MPKPDPKLCGNCGRYPSEHPHAACERHVETSNASQMIELGRMHGRLLIATQQAAHELMVRCASLMGTPVRPAMETPLWDLFLRVASEVLPDAQPHAIVLVEGGAAYTVSNRPPPEARALLQLAIDTIDARGGEARYVEEA